MPVKRPEGIPGEPSLQATRGPHQLTRGKSKCLSGGIDSRMASRLGRAPVLARAGWPAVRSGCWGDRLLTSHAGALGPEQLRSDADLADLSSLTYGPTRSPADLAGQLQAKGLNLVAEGTAPFTR